jgi:hypothetical protein
MPLQSVSVQCPYCGETIEVDVELFGEDQSYIEDCNVCCRPIEFSITESEEGPDVRASRSD